MVNRTLTESPMTYYNMLIIFQGAINFKFGVLYRKMGQTTDDQILCNSEQKLILQNTFFTCDSQRDSTLGIGELFDR